MLNHLRKSPSLKTVVEVSKYKGKKYLNIRDWYKKSDGEYAPTQKGVAIPLELAKDLPRLIKEALAGKNKPKKNKEHKKHKNRHSDEEE